MTKKNVYRLVSGCLNNLKDIKGKYTLHGNCTFSSVSSTHICC